MSTDKEIPTLWAKTKVWVSNNRTVSGALAGLAAGSVIPGIGNIFGVIVGAGVGYASAKEKERQDKLGLDKGN